MIKRSPADAAFSECIRFRVGYNCERCGKNYAHNTQGLHCSHYFGRRHKRTRWEPLNCMSLCAACHFHVTENPYEHTQMFQARLGSVFEVLDELHRQVLRKKDYCEKAIAKHYRAEMERMKALRDQGNNGLLHLVGYF